MHTRSKKKTTYKRCVNGNFIKAVNHRSESVSSFKDSNITEASRLIDVLCKYLMENLNLYSVKPYIYIEVKKRAHEPSRKFSKYSPHSFLRCQKSIFFSSTARHFFCLSPICPNYNCSCYFWPYNIIICPVSNTAII